MKAFLYFPIFFGLLRALLKECIAPPPIPVRSSSMKAMNSARTMANKVFPKLKQIAQKVQKGASHEIGQAKLRYRMAVKADHNAAPPHSFTGPGAHQYSHSQHLS